MCSGKRFNTYQMNKVSNLPLSFLFPLLTVLACIVGSMGTLKVTGYLKGATLSVNQLVHIPGLGDFQLAQVDAVTDPNNLEKNKYVCFNLIK